VNHELKCPACQQPLFLPDHLEEMETIFAARVICDYCGKMIFISEDVPMVDETA
jgi:ribosomal protein S27AE